MIHYVVSWGPPRVPFVVRPPGSHSSSGVENEGECPSFQEGQTGPCGGEGDLGRTVAAAASQAGVLRSWQDFWCWLAQCS